MMAAVRATAGGARRRVSESCWTRLDRVTTVLGLLLPAAAVVIASVLTWRGVTSARDLLIFAGMWVATGLGLTVGFHRMLAHRSFQALPPVRFVLLALGCAAGMADPIRWTAIHIQHHARADAEGE